MKIAILHYHLNRGGVTQVIVNHLRSLNELAPANRREIALIYSGRREGWPENINDELVNLDISLCEVPRLDYDDGSSADAASLAQEIRDQLAAHGFAPDETILHVHNHNLGKNLSLPGALAQLAAHGYRLLLQIHDFAEDFRPDLYSTQVDVLASGESARLPRLLYPQAEHVQYAVLNRRDHQVLEAAGVPSARVHFLPNPVAEFGEFPSRETARDELRQKCGIDTGRCLLLYPVRGIRRKNIGELLLWSAAAGGQAAVANTLAPLNPVEVSAYQSWKDLATELELPCHFELGDHLSFKDNLAASDWLVSTSVAEGFGMVFLEAWLAGRPLAGRNLREITADFVERDLRLDWMGDEVWVPLDWVGEDEFRRAIFDSYSKELAAYRKGLAEPSLLDGEISHMINEGAVDFASLSVPLQRKVVRSVCADAGYGEALFERNPHLRAIFSATQQQIDDTVEHNAHVVRDNYAPAGCGQRLNIVYETLMEADCGEALDGPPHGEKILDFFLDIKRFRPLRSQT